MKLMRKGDTNLKERQAGDMRWFGERLGKEEMK